MSLPPEQKPAPGNARPEDAETAGGKGSPGSAGAGDMLRIFRGLGARQPQAPEAGDAPADGEQRKPEEAASGPAVETSTRNLFADDSEETGAPVPPAGGGGADAPSAAGRGSMWDLASEIAEARQPARPDPAAEAAETTAPLEPPDPRERRPGRVKTRVLGIDHSNGTLEAIQSRAAGPGGPQVMFPVGWLVIAGGPGRGTAFALRSGVSSIGRGEDQAVPLDFGDTAISREGHAVVAFDDETGSFFLGHGGKSNLVRLNGKPVLSTVALAHGDRIRLGETTLVFVALCGEGFSWAESAPPED